MVLNVSTYERHHSGAVGFFIPVWNVFSRVFVPVGEGVRKPPKTGPRRVLAGAFPGWKSRDPLERFREGAFQYCEGGIPVWNGENGVKLISVPYRGTHIDFRRQNDGNQRRPREDKKKQPRRAKIVGEIQSGHANACRLQGHGTPQLLGSSPISA